VLADAWTIFRKDLLIERRSRELFFSVVAFGVLAAVLFALSFYIDDDRTKAYTPGIIWVTVLYAGSLALGRLFDAERENDCLGGLLLSPADPRGLYLGKLMTLLVAMAVMEAVTLPLVMLFFDLFRLLDATTAALGFLALVLGTIGFALVGTLFAAMLLSSRLREILVPVIVFPLVTPVLIAGVQCTRALLEGHTNVWNWISLLASFDLIYLAVALAIFPLMVRE
jgi:heme exporter protein B